MNVYTQICIPGSWIKILRHSQRPQNSQMNITRLGKPTWRRSRKHSFSHTYRKLARLTGTHLFRLLGIKLFDRTLPISHKLTHMKLLRRRHVIMTSIVVWPVITVRRKVTFVPQCYALKRAEARKRETDLSVVQHVVLETKKNLIKQNSKKLIQLKLNRCLTLIGAPLHLHVQISHSEVLLCWETLVLCSHSFLVISFWDFIGLW